MKHAFIDRYAHIKSPIHGLSPSLKIKFGLFLLALLLIGIPMISSDFSRGAYWIYGFIVLIIALSSHVPFSFLLTRSALVLPFSVLIIIVNFFSGNFSLNHMIETLFKSLFSIFTLLLLTSTTPFHEILKQLSNWGAPKLFIIILAFMYRYFFLLVGEIEALERAVRMRHSSVSGWKRITTNANIIGMLLVRSFERAENVYRAMRMRGFTGDLT